MVRATRKWKLKDRVTIGRKAIILFSVLILFHYMSLVSEMPMSKLYVHQNRQSEKGRVPSILARRSDWEESSDAYCKALINQPMPFDRNCRYNPRVMKCSNESSAPVMFSQYYQDYYLFTRHFKYLTRPGIYVDVATNHPISISNTYFFDRCLRWHGICVEANDEYYEPIFLERSCRLVPTCVGSKEGEVVQFGMYGGLGGILGGTYKSMKRFHMQNNTYAKQLRCATMRSVTSMFSIREIDYLSLDVEGHELEVLKGFDFEKVKINVMTVESAQKKLVRIEKFLSSVGYRRLTVEHNNNNLSNLLLREDAIFIHNSVEFGSPV